MAILWTNNITQLFVYNYDKAKKRLLMDVIHHFFGAFFGLWLGFTLHEKLKPILNHNEPLELESSPYIYFLYALSVLICVTIIIIFLARAFNKVKKRRLRKATILIQVYYIPLGAAIAITGCIALIETKLKLGSMPTPLCLVFYLPLILIAWIVAHEAYRR